MRKLFFRLVQGDKVPCDLPFYLQMLKTLTENGRDIQNFEEEIGMFMLNWMDNIIEGKSNDPSNGMFVKVDENLHIQLDSQLLSSSLS